MKTTLLVIASEPPGLQQEEDSVELLQTACPPGEGIFEDGREISNAAQ